MYCRLIAEGKCTREDLNSDTQSWTAELSAQLKHIDDEVTTANHLEKQWAGLVQVCKLI